MSRHHPDLVMCRKAAGISIGRLCDKCDGKCPVCDSYVRPTTLARVCDECSFGNYQNKCIVCGGEGISDAFYCFECTRLEKDRDGCPKIINLGSSRTDLFFNFCLLSVRSRRSAAPTAFAPVSLTFCSAPTPHSAIRMPETAIALWPYRLVNLWLVNLRRATVGTIEFRPTVTSIN
ncbi:hypothetical protein DV736_g2046, partial [Chaetothyriales sp. CBS 134916]